MAPSTYYDIKSRRPSARSQRDAVLAPALRQLWEDTTGSTVLASYGKLRVALDTISVVTRLFD